MPPSLRHSVDSGRLRSIDFCHRLIGLVQRRSSVSSSTGERRRRVHEMTTRQARPFRRHRTTRLREYCSVCACEPERPEQRAHVLKRSRLTRMDLTRRPDWRHSTTRSSAQTGRTGGNGSRATAGLCAAWYGVPQVHSHSPESWVSYCAASIATSLRAPAAYSSFPERFTLNSRISSHSRCWISPTMT